MPGDTIMRPIVARVAILSTLLFLTAVPARSTQVVPRTSQELGRDSALVVRGTVEEVRSFWTPSRTKIFTEVVVRVEEGYKGGASEQIRILQLGGSVDGVRVTVSGALQWRDQEEVLLFLEPYVKDTYQVSGFSQGKFRIERDPATGEANQIDLGGPLPSGDGLVLAGKTLYVVQNQLNQIGVITLSTDLGSGVVGEPITDPAFNVPTTADLFGSSLYAVNAKFGTPPVGTPYEVVRVDRN
jgi:hypothetical protein